MPSDSVAVMQRFGKYLTEVPPGLHLKLPLGVDIATIVPVKRQLKQEFGFTTPGASDPYQSPRDGQKETEMVTGDLNAALVEWVVQYRISDPVKFLFEVREPSETLRYVSESVMREVVGDRTVDEVITIGRQEIETEALAKMQALATKYEMGISIDQVQLKNINPPATSSGIVQRGQPGSAGKGEAHQRGPARLQQSDPTGRGREGPAHPRGRWIQTQADQ